MTDPPDFDFDNLETLDLPPSERGSPADPDPGVVGGPECEVCGNVIPWSGRGRRPLRCVEHKKKPASAGVRQPRAAKTEVRLKALEDDLLREFTVAGKGLAQFMPTAGVTLVKRAERTTRALLRIAEDNPKMLQALETAAKVAPAIDLGETLGAVGLAIMVDAGRVNPDSLLPTLFGVRETWHELNDDTSGEEMPQAGNGFGGMPEQTVPLRFQEIT